MANKTKNVIFYLEYLLFRGVAALINALPLKSIYPLSEAGGSFLFFILRKRREIALVNLRAAFGSEKPEEELRRIAKASMQNLVKFALEFIRIPRMVSSKEALWEMKGGENLLEGQKLRKGVIIILGHFGNWEWMGYSAINFMKEPLYAVARPIKNPYVYDYVKRLRNMAGFESIDKNGAVRSTIKLLKEGKVTAMLIDQHERQGAVWVDFFGRKASTTTVPAVLALKYNTTNLFTYSLRKTGKDAGKYTHYFEKPFPLIRTGNDEEDIYANTQQYVKRIEEIIKLYPENWLWMHRRWREMPKN